MRVLHMVTADPQRTPTLVMFNHPDYFAITGAADCSSPLTLTTNRRFTTSLSAGTRRGEAARLRSSMN